MKIQITVKPNAKRNFVEKRADGVYRVSVKAPPVDGKANAAVVETLAAFFKVPKSSIDIFRGASSKRKWVKIGNDY